MRGKPPRVENVIIRYKHEIGTGSAQQVKIPIERPRIGAEILMWPELQWIHIDTDGNRTRQGTRLLDKSQVPGVQVAHGWHERKRWHQHPPRRPKTF